MVFQIPIELARKHPALTATDIVFIGERVRFHQESSQSIEIHQIYEIAFKEFLDSKGISY